MQLKTVQYTQDPLSLPDWDSLQTLVMVFGAPEFIDKPDAIAEIASKYPNSTVIGCSSAGEIYNTRLFDNSLSVAVIRFEHTTIQHVIHPATDSFAAGQTIAQQLNRPSLQAVFVLSDGLNVNGSELVRGMNSVLPESVVVTGGLAGDGDRFNRTWVIKDGKPQSDCISAVGLYGDKLHMGHGSKGGWDTFGPERVITRSEGNILYELDGKPALQLYKTYLGDRATGLPATGLLFPLALRANADDEKSIVRTILAVDEEAQTLTFAGDVPQGSLAQLMKANFDRLVDGAKQAATMSLNSEANGGPALSIAISCVGRRLVLGERTEDELEATLNVLPDNTQQIGFYSYGEISPFASGYCDLHNQTMTLTTIREG